MLSPTATPLEFHMLVQKPTDSAFELTDVVVPAARPGSDAEVNQPPREPSGLIFTSSAISTTGCSTSHTCMTLTLLLSPRTTPTELRMSTPAIDPPSTLVLMVPSTPGATLAS